VLKEILGETNSIMVYQEQVMRILNRLGDIPLASAYTVIKAISKKKESLINQNREKFLEGSVANGLKKEDAEDIWNLIQKFAGYGFNKSHSTAYALVAYQTAYLKAHYPVEFMAALLSSDITGRNFKRKDALVEHMEDCARMGIEVVPPNVNLSDSRFRGEGRQDHFRVVGDQGLWRVGGRRRRGGPQGGRPLPTCSIFVSGSISRPATSAIETLIKAGAMDCLRCSAEPIVGGDREGVADRGGGAGGSQEWPGESVWRFRRRTRRSRKPRRFRCPTCRHGLRKNNC
jgi:DNA polymerase III subunit alpha